MIAIATRTASPMRKWKSGIRTATGTGVRTRIRRSSESKRPSIRANPTAIRSGTETSSSKNVLLIRKKNAVTATSSRKTLSREMLNRKTLNRKNVILIHRSKTNADVPRQSRKTWNKGSSRMRARIRIALSSAM